MTSPSLGAHFTVDNSFLLNAASVEYIDSFNREGRRRGSRKPSENENRRYEVPVSLSPSREGMLKLFHKAFTQKRKNKKPARENLPNLWTPAPSSYPGRSLGSWLEKRKGTEFNSEA